MPNHLEPRVTKVESDISIIRTELGGALRALADQSESINALANLVRQQGNESTVWREKISEAVIKAGAPRRTDFSMLISLAMLIIALGALAFAPLLWRQGETQKDVDEVAKKFDAHSSLTLHPVGAEKIAQLEKMMTERSEINRQLIRDATERYTHELALVLATVNQHHESLEARFDSVEKYGSPITRERLALIEARLENQGRKKKRQ